MIPGRRAVSLAVVASVAVVSAGSASMAAAADVVVGSKKFTESVILGEIAAQLLRHGDFDAWHRAELGGSRVLWNALRRGDIDAYPEYTGTLRYELLAGRDVPAGGRLDGVLAEVGVASIRPLGFDNTYALGMRGERADALGIDEISDLVRHPGLGFGFTNEFLDREDGWPGLRDRYALPQDDVRGLDHDLAYRGLASGHFDVADLYSTDAEIRYYDLRLLEDDLGYFPDYRAVYLYRAELETGAPAVVSALRRLEGRIDADEMVEMNARVKLDGESETAVAADFLARELGLEDRRAEETAAGDRLVRHTMEHLRLVGISLAAAILIALPLGIVAARRPRFGQLILGAVGIVQTIPSLALLVFMIPLLGIGGPPAIAALFLYSLLPIVRNTHAGLNGIPAAIRESARALGLTSRARLLRVELPMASPAILAGIKISAVINVGTATLGALIGAGGYGQPILTGIRLDDVGLILQGAVPAAVLALLAQGLFEVVEWLVVPAGLRLADPS